MTEYRLAASGRDYARAHELMAAEGFESQELSFPTVIALKGQELTGFLSTHISNKMVCAGPLILKNGQARYWTLIRLIETYENVMRTAGITAFVFSVDNGAAEWLDKIAKTVELEPYAEKGGRKFFIRKL